MPRNELDIRVIAGLMCVSDRRRPRAILDYYDGIEQATRRNPIDRQIVLSEYDEVMDAYGISGERRATCEDNHRSHALIASIYALADDYRTRDRVPVVVYDDAYVDTIEFDEVMNRIKERRAK